MMTKIKIGVVIGMIVSLAALWLLSASRTHAPVSPNSENVSVTESPVRVDKASAPVRTPDNTGNIHIRFTAGSVETTLSAKQGDTLYAAMLRARTAGEIRFSGVDHPALGFFVTEVGSLKQGGGKYLFYSVNGVEATTGISSHVLADGDSIVWTLK